MSARSIFRYNPKNAKILAATCIPASRLDGLPPLREVAAAHGLLAKKSLGQNFLFDLNLTSRIARAAAPADQCDHCRDRPRPRRAHAGVARRRRAQSHRDRARRALPRGARRRSPNHYPGRLDVIEGDALETDFAGLIGGESPARVCANLPYNIATPLLVRWLETEPWPPWFDRLVLMFQREVAERIVAGPAERAAYGRLAVLSNWRCETRILFDIPAAAFTPPPKVRSSLVELVPRPSPLACDSKTAVGGDASSLRTKAQDAAAIAEIARGRRCRRFARPRGHRSNVAGGRDRHRRICCIGSGTWERTGR